MIVGRSVLLIDDDSWIVGVFQRVLKKAGFSVHHAAHALDGIEMIDKIHPSVVVLDVMMPGPNGFVLLHEIRSHSDLAQIPIIICTNAASEIPKNNLSSYGVAEVLDKTTMSPDDIVSAVRRVI